MLAVCIISAFIKIRSRKQWEGGSLLINMTLVYTYAKVKNSRLPKAVLPFGGPAEAT